MWKERDNSPLSKEDRLRARLEPNHDVGWLYFVLVCGFTFRFGRLDEIQEYIDFYSMKILPSSRRPAHDPESGLFAGDHWERQTRFDRLPLYLREESKRKEVAQVLSQAQAVFTQQ
jgi:hypothetical protein